MSTMSPGRYRLVDPRIAGFALPHPQRAKQA
jgi:hypothetical protein